VATPSGTLVGSLSSTLAMVSGAPSRSIQPFGQRIDPAYPTGQ